MMPLWSTGKWYRLTGCHLWPGRTTYPPSSVETLTTTTHTTVLRLFPGPPRWASARRKLPDFVVQGKINRGRHRDYPAGRNSIRTNQCPLPSSPGNTKHWPYPMAGLVSSSRCAQSHTRRKGYFSFHAGCPTSAPEILQSPPTNPSINQLT